MTLLSVLEQLAGIKKEITNLVNAVSKGLYGDELKVKMDDLQVQQSMLKVRLEEAEHEQKNFLFTKNRSGTSFRSSPGSKI